MRPSKIGSALRGKNLLLGDQISSFKCCLSFGKDEMEELLTLTVYPYTLKLFVMFNPIALRKAKIVCNFGLSECNRINCLQTVWFYFIIFTDHFLLFFSGLKVYRPFYYEKHMLVLIEWAGGMGSGRMWG